MRCIARGIFIAVLYCSSLTASAWFEFDPAGRLPATAQNTSGAGSLDVILGELTDLTEVDMFWIRIADAMAFSASTVPDPFTVADPELFLFDRLGKGVYANDDANGSQSELPAAHPLGPASAGLYLLAIGRFDNEPVSSSGFIFTQNAGVNGPTAGGGSPITGWDDNVTGRIDLNTFYQISLTGGEFANIPEPATLILSGAGLLLAYLLKRRR
jgi:hypothetical protein